MKTNRVALFGRMGSGKSELGSLLEGFTKVAWGDAVKKEFIMNGLASQYGVIDKSQDRSILQSFGQMRRGEIETFKFKLGHCFMRSTPIGKFAWRVFSRPVWDDITMRRLPEYDSIGPCYQDYWIDQAMPRIKTLLEVGAPVLNDDIRRLNEWEALKHLGFTIIKVHTDEAIRIERMKKRDGGVDLTTLNDISESEIDDLPYDALVINNYDTIETAWNSLLDVIS